MATLLSLSLDLCMSIIWQYCWNSSDSCEFFRSCWIYLCKWNISDMATQSPLVCVLRSIDQWLRSAIATRLALHSLTTLTNTQHSLSALVEDKWLTLLLLTAAAASCQQYPRPAAASFAVPNLNANKAKEEYFYLTAFDFGHPQKVVGLIRSFVAHVYLHLQRHKLDWKRSCNACQKGRHLGRGSDWKRLKSTTNQFLCHCSRKCCHPAKFCLFSLFACIVFNLAHQWDRVGAESHSWRWRWSREPGAGAGCLDGQ